MKEQKKRLRVGAIEGRRFGRIVALWHSYTTLGRVRRHFYVCICDCGRVVTRDRGNLVSRARSCGCVGKRGVIKSFHGMSKTRIYRLWNGIRQRCLNPKFRDYPRYGGRGITLCDRWRVFENFAQDVGEVPKNRSFDRIDNNQGYSPENCRWATRTVQQRNRRNTRYLTLNGETKPLVEWCEIHRKNYTWAYQAIFLKGKNPLDFFCAES